MFNRLIAWFDDRYSPVALAADRQPPTGLWKFVFYFVGQFRTAFLIRLGLVAVGAVADAMMPIFVGLVVGFLATTNPASGPGLRASKLFWNCFQSSPGASPRSWCQRWRTGCRAGILSSLLVRRRLRFAKRSPHWPTRV